MPYTAEISRANPSCLLFLLDQSGSMNENFCLPGEPPISKALGVSTAVNRLIGNFVVASTRGAEVYDHIHVGVITYGGEGVGHPPHFQGLLGLSEVAENPLRVESRTQEAFDGAGGIIRKEIKMPVWFDPQANGGTPMCQALAMARGILQSWCESHPDSFPPIIINVTDGEAGDGDPLQGLRELQACGTQDGPALTFNVFLANGQSHGSAYPTGSGHLPEGPLRSLVEGSSILPEAMRRRAMSDHEISIPEGGRGVLIQASIVDLVKFLDIGSRPMFA